MSSQDAGYSDLLKKDQENNNDEQKQNYQRYNPRYKQMWAITPEQIATKHLWKPSCGAIFVCLGKDENSTKFIVCESSVGFWSFPKGELMQGETIPGCASREIKEETGIDIPETSLENYPQVCIDSKYYYYVIHVSSIDQFNKFKISTSDEILDVQWKSAEELRNMSTNPSVRKVVGDERINRFFNKQLRRVMLDKRPLTKREIKGKKHAISYVDEPTYNIIYKSTRKKRNKKSGPKTPLIYVDKPENK